MKVRLTTSSRLLLFRILLGLLLLHVSSAQETRGGVGKTEPTGESRIIGGSQATEGRYPYAVSLVSGGSHFCGGSLIAPDMVLSAAHCGGLSNIGVEVGRHNRQDFFENYESISVLRKIPHPNYVDGESLQFDIMLLQLARPVTNTQSVRVNLDDDMPGANQDVTVMGWGLQDGDNDNSLSPVLLEAQLTTLTNDDCEDSKNPDFAFSSYRGQIFDDMLCAYESGKDSCQGDSGGPLIMETNNGDLQVGVVSWGFGCAVEFFPGVYSRPSYDKEWLIAKVCQYSSDAPAYFNCPGTSPVPAPVASPTEPPIPPTPIELPPGYLEGKLTIQMDSYPAEIGWRLERIGVSTEVVAQRTPGVYTVANAVIAETFALEEGEIYTLIIFDVHTDGICCDHGNGNYRLEVAGRQVVDGDGEFKAGRDHTFIASEEETTTPPPAPLVAGDLFLELQIQFDQFPEEVGWILRLNDGSSTRQSQVMAFKPTRSYSNTLATQMVQEVIPLSEPGDFTFHFLDSFGDGLCCQYGDGFYRLYEGTIDEGTLVASGNAQAESRESTSFSIDGSRPPVMPDPPTVSPAPTTPNVDVNFVLRPDEYPQDIGWSIKDYSGRTVYSRSPGYYASTDVVSETFSLESDKVYNFTITDELENGICCDNGIGTFRIDTGNGLVAFGGNFRGSESTVFSTPGKIPVALAIQADEYPEEIHWKLERLDLSETAIVATVREQTYDTKNELIERDFMVSEEGFYRFTIFDFGRDGICCKHGQGYIDLSVDGRVVADQDPGEFGLISSYHFLGAAGLPAVSNPRKLTLSITFDEYPRETSWLLFQSNDDTTVAVERAQRRDSGAIMAYGPTGASYSSSLKRTTYTEVIEVEAIPDGDTRSFTFIMLDSAGDGLCCSYGFGSYTLFDEESGNSTNVLLTGSAANRGRETQTFSLTSEGIAFSPSPTPTIFYSGAATLFLQQWCIVVVAVVSTWAMC